jgi:Uma2 family endonuclease
MKSSLLRRKTAKQTRPVRVVFEGDLEIPPITNLEEFREWARSDKFPERGRIDYIDGRIEVAPVTEDALTHGSPKTEIARVISNRVRELRLGHAFVDATRVSCEEVELSAEPDIVVVTHDSISRGRVRFLSGQSKLPRRFVELDGAPDLVVEVLSDSSVAKDTEWLFRQYFEAGVSEYWLADARGDDLLFQIHHRTKSGFKRAPRDKESYQQSRILDARYRFEREEDLNDTWFYTLRESK